MAPLSQATEQERIREILTMVKDPEIPVLSIQDMGILQSVQVTAGNAVQVSIIPTYSGCPAMDVIREEIKTVLLLHGYGDVCVKTILSPAWSSDLITAHGRRKLQEFGIAPPAGKSSDQTGEGPDVACPYCQSTDTRLVSQFGSTACKALYKCNNCLEPFDYFKCV
ncbi:1,2-phenylacetyl-CoA epoxidase subunit PaaD [Sneathiella chinensis]|uniref:Phenylacetic acid degradation protein n=1 Tax=Sneathiella chinensis TaxID=349750 RepID=A0ABQ5U853_9PROT|nr:1,2-phenylacetyl-CoA epoxidase subunit PaaD [Sneathiella chinensis]GLQ06656.1 phenylacetic acid degradation protein [Sneathiella chinensis]